MDLATVLEMFRVKGELLISRIEIDRRIGLYRLLPRISQSLESKAEKKRQLHDCLANFGCGIDSLIFYLPSDSPLRQFYTERLLRPIEHQLTRQMGAISRLQGTKSGLKLLADQLRNELKELRDQLAVIPATDIDMPTKKEVRQLMDRIDTFLAGAKFDSHKR